MLDRAIFFWITALVIPVHAHMSYFSSAMYAEPWTSASAGFGENYNAADPLGPGWKFDDWWMRGAATRASPPLNGAVQELPAGKTITVEIACHIAHTTVGGASPTSNVACPNNNGAYHAGDPNGPVVERSMVQGCGLAIADVDDINKVTMDNLAVFSVQKDCVLRKNTTFEIPARMPKCSGTKCICTWMWLAANGTGNFYMTPFDCQVTNVQNNAAPIAMPLKDPKPCYGDSRKCVKGAKRPIYIYNDIWNVQWIDNLHRPGYNLNWGYNNGPQNDIFVESVPKGPPAKAPPAKTTAVQQSPPTRSTNTPKASRTKRAIVADTGRTSNMTISLAPVVSRPISARRRNYVPIQPVGGSESQDLLQPSNLIVIAGRARQIAHDMMYAQVVDPITLYSGLTRIDSLGASAEQLPSL